MGIDECLGWQMEQHLTYSYDIHTKYSAYNKLFIYSNYTKYFQLNLYQIYTINK